MFITISEVVEGPPDLAVYSGYSEEEVAAGPGRWEKSVENDHPSTEVSSLIDHSPLMVYREKFPPCMRSRVSSSPK